MRVLKTAGWIGLLPFMSLATTTPPGEPAMVGFRGNGSGIYSARNIPTTWDIASGKNILWSAPLPECALSEPISIAGKVFVCCEPELLVCYDATTGKELWKVTASALDGEPRDKQEKAQEILKNIIAHWKSGADMPKEKTDPLTIQIDSLKKDFGIEPLRNWLFGWQGYAYNTPFSDGHLVWVRFGTGSVGCYELEGRRVWLKRVSNKGGINVLSSQMLVIKGKVIFVESIPPDKRAGTPALYKLTGLDANTGEETWHSKPFPPGDHSWASGVTVVHVGGTAYVVTSGGQIIDPDSGEIVGEKFGNWGYCQTVYAADGAIYFGPQRIRLKRDGARIVSDDPLPTGKTADRVVAYDGKVYVAKPDSLNCFDPSTPLGEQKTWPKLTYNIPGDKTMKDYRVTPIIADGLLFCPAAAGKLVVVKPGAKPEIQATNSFPAPITASPFASEGRLFVRTTTTLYCISQSQ